MILIAERKFAMRHTFCRWVSLIALIALLTGCDGGSTDSTPSDSATQATSAVTTAQTTSAVTTASPCRDGTIYKGGKYEGVGYGKNGSIRLSVTLDNDKIVAIDLIAHCETENLFVPAYEAVKSAVLDKENPDLSEVDSVSGATLSCQGLLDAIRNALYKARI